MTRIVLLAILAVLVGSATPARAHHRVTPPITPVTSSGDNFLPRARPDWRRFAIIIDPARLATDGYLEPASKFDRGTFLGHSYMVRSDWFKKSLEVIIPGGNGANPTISKSGDEIAWDADCVTQYGCPSGETGRQVYFWRQGEGSTQLTHDPTGTSVNPFIAGRGNQIAFESQGDLAGTGTSGGSQIFLITAMVTGPVVVTQVTYGVGTSRNAVLSQSGRTMAFESTNDESGNDTGVSQIWLVTPGTAAPITHGAVSSQSPSVSIDGRFVTFESTAALVGDRHDTGVNQIFVYDVQRGVLSQLTNEASGCSRPSVELDLSDWRVVFVCNGIGYFELLNANQRFQLPIPAGADTPEVTGLGPNFLWVSTTAALSCPRCDGQGCAEGTCATSGTTPDHQLFVINKWKIPAIPVTSSPGSPSGAFLEAPAHYSCR